MIEARRTCPVIGCPAERKPGLLLCRTHWFKVTPATRALFKKRFVEFKAIEKSGAPAELIEASRKSLKSIAIRAVRSADWRSRNSNPHLGGLFDESVE